MNNFWTNRPEPLLNSVDIVWMLDNIASDCMRFNVDRTSLQAYMEATTYESKIDILIDLTSNALNFNQNFIAI